MQKPPKVKHIYFTQAGSQDKQRRRKKSSAMKKGEPKAGLLVRGKNRGEYSYGMSLQLVARVDELCYCYGFFCRVLTPEFDNTSS
jgi:hypothetical protein